MGVEIELRHLRYFIAVAEAGSLTVAAQRKLFTSQPSLSRQIRDLEDEVGAQLLRRNARGIEQTFLSEIGAGSTVGRYAIGQKIGVLYDPEEKISPMIASASCADFGLMST